MSGHASRLGAAGVSSWALLCCVAACEAEPLADDVSSNKSVGGRQSDGAEATDAELEASSDAPDVPTESTSDEAGSSVQPSDSAAGGSANVPDIIPAPATDDPVNPSPVATEAASDVATGGGANLDAGAAVVQDAATQPVPALPTELPMECETAADCELSTDPCTCQALPLGGSGKPCPVERAFTACERDEFTSADLICNQGICQLNRMCESEEPCEATLPECPAGQRLLHSDEGSATRIWHEDCARFTSCEGCTDDEVCVETATWFNAMHECRPRLASCEPGNLAACIGREGCLEEDGVVLCSCGGC